MKALFGMFFFENRKLPARWFIVSALAVSLLCTGLSFAGVCEVTVGPEGITGHAENASLKTVLQQLSKQTGYKVHLDQKLMDETVSFRFREALEPERALKRMVHPHSHALVFGKSASHAMRILEIRVYGKGTSGPVSFSAIDPAVGAIGSTVGSGAPGNGHSAVTDLWQASVINTSGSIGSIDSRNRVRLPYERQTGPFGSTLLKIPEIKGGPDPRPDIGDMRRAYQYYRKDKTAFLERQKNAEKRHARQQLNQRKTFYAQQHKQAVQAYLETAQQKN